MGEFGREIGAVAMAIIGLAIIAVLVKSQGTVGVIKASTSGFASVLGTAMGGSPSSVVGGGF